MQLKHMQVERIIKEHQSAILFYSHYTEEGPACVEIRHLLDDLQQMLDFYYSVTILGFDKIAPRDQKSQS